MVGRSSKLVATDVVSGGPKPTYLHWRGGGGVGSGVEGGCRKKGQGQGKEEG